MIVDGAKLRNGHTRSCGCLSQSVGEALIEDLLKNNKMRYTKEKIFEELGR